jgi:hypothetical protein
MNYKTGDCRFLFREALLMRTKFRLYIRRNVVMNNKLKCLGKFVEKQYWSVIGNRSTVPFFKTRTFASY